MTIVQRQPTRVLLIRHGRSTFNDQGRYQGCLDESVLTPQGLATAKLVGQYLNQQCSPPRTNARIEAIYTSPLRRVEQTATAISEAISLPNRPPIISHPQLKELSLSLWEGLPYTYVKQHYAEQYRCWQQQPESFELPVPITHYRDAIAPTPAETIPVTTLVATPHYFPLQDLYASAQQFWQTILPQHPGHTVVVVSHSGTIHALISTALGLSPAHHHGLQQSNCGVSELSFYPTEAPKNPTEAPKNSAIPLSSPETSTKTLTACTQLNGEPTQLDYSVKIHQLNQTSVLGELLPKLKVNNKGLRLLLLPLEGLTTDDYACLAERLKPLPIDFGLASDAARDGLHRLMKHRSDVLCLGTQGAGFLQTWQWLLSQAHLSTELLTTGLAIAPAASIQTFLMQTLVIQTSRSPTRQPLCSFSAKTDRIILQPKHLSIVHYPYQHRPVVQAINTFSAVQSQH